MRRTKGRKFGLKGSDCNPMFPHRSYRPMWKHRVTKPDIYKFYTKNMEIVQNFIGQYQVKIVSFREIFVLSLNIDFLCSHF